MKKLLICLSLLFSILFIDKVNALTSLDYTQMSLKTVKYLTQKAYNDENLTNNLMNNYYKYCVLMTDSNNELLYIICQFYPKNHYNTSFNKENCVYNSEKITGNYNFTFNYKTKEFVSAYQNVSINTGYFTWYNRNDKYPMTNPFDSSQKVVSSFADESFYLDQNNDIFLNWTPFDNYELGFSLNVNFHLNNGKVFDLNVDCDEFSCTLPEYKYTDFTVNLKTTEISNYIRNLDMSKETMVFDGWYYDEKLTKRYEIDDEIETDIDLYAKWKYKNTDDFLKNTNFIDYTFDTNYQYAIITKGANTGDVYLGLEYMTYNLELYEYDKNNSSYKDGATLCITPYYSKDDIYYYFINTELNDNIEVLVLPKEKLEVDDKTYYNFKLSDNAHITYSNDLKNFEIYDENDNKINTDIENSYLNSQESLINDENDLITIFKDLFKFKDNKVFQYFNQMWEILKTSDLYAYFIILIVGSLIILVIKSASRGG